MMDIKRNILLNPGPATTTDTVKLAQLAPDICPREKEFAALMAGLREDLVRVVHGDPEKHTAVLFCGSGTLCMDVCLNSLLPEGKQTLIVHNGAYSARAVEICRSYGLPHIDLTLPYDRPADLAAVEEALRANPEVALVYATHNETGTGLLNPIRELGALAHQYGAVFITDTTSTYAMRPIDIETDHIDFCMASAQKGLMAMTGLSFVIGRRDLIEVSKDYPRRSYYANLFRQYDCFQRTGEMEFTPPVQTVYAALQAMKEYWAEGEQAKWARHTRTMNAIHAGLEALGFRETIRSEWQAGLVAAVRNPNDPNWDFQKVHDYCYERGFTIYPGKVGTVGTFRLCALGAIDEGDIRAFFRVFRDALDGCGVAVPVRYGG
jgi:2-aminoethylphosphonate-pyruvate transaminase